LRRSANAILLNLGHHPFICSQFTEIHTMSEKVKEEPTTEVVLDLETIVAKAKREFALKHYEQAATLYATALEN
jgi:hypothetical protein